MELCSIASGSSGNCIMAGGGDSRLLIDAGISGKRIEKGLNSLGHKTSEMKGVLVTHEHIDHISGLGVIARRYGLPIYATRGTVEAISNTAQVGKIDPCLFHIIKPDQEFTVGGLKALPVRISHDAADPVAYIIRSGGKSAGVITDLGAYGEHLVERLSGISLLLLEANHDVNMLQAGPYPYYLKRRIMGDRGHLSNESCGRLLARLLHDNCKGVLLGHLSKENNYPSLALEAVRMEITMGNCPYGGKDFPIFVANRDGVSELLAI
ncbi:MAG: MBL fold metallo-hydrolase [Eubacterium sp.]|jgi:phosphoribosyl 1,2-cyclic phosphodiesterase|nr:MBL fold metallo-hydrolase [Eubacterium sp.]NBI84868.1 MBL fold metallo-hydrolase [Lachnospiraceae bacterium]